ncbi:MAG TPA: hypothetical protein VHT34_09630 [Clostridia bacterium]|nr:hypothetical protein [Clostridia bacterium]
MARVRKRVTLNVTLLIALIAFIMIAEAAGSTLLILMKQNNYDTHISSLTTEIADNKKVVLIPTIDIKAGQELTLNMFSKSMVYAAGPQSSYLSQDDIEVGIQKGSGELKTGSWALIDIDAGTPVTRKMVADEKISHDLRREEFNSFLLQSDILKDQFIDVRICFPNGENYIILSKKKVRDLSIEKNTIWLWLDDKEILSISSAIVDAYIHKGSKIYTNTYVAPGMQKVAIPTYPVNPSVLALIKSDPNILPEAKKGLNGQVRALLDARLGGISPMQIANIAAGVNQEEANRNAKIQNDSAAKQTQAQPQQTQNEKDNNNTGSKKEFFN